MRYPSPRKNQLFQNLNKILRRYKMVLSSSTAKFVFMILLHISMLGDYRMAIKIDIQNSLAFARLQRTDSPFPPILIFALKVVQCKSELEKFLIANFKDKKKMYPNFFISSMLTQEKPDSVLVFEKFLIPGRNFTAIP